MAKALPYFRWYPADAETDELYASLTDAELGFYHRCLNKSWINNGLPADLDQLANVMKVNRKYLDKIWAKLAPVWFERDGRLFNRRQEEERTHAITKSERATDAVRTRYERRTNELPRAYESVSVSGFVDLKKEKPSETPKKQEVTSERFDEFWEKYPVKEGMPIAFGVWATLVTKDNEDAVFACLERYLASDRGMRSPKNPANWLHDCARDNWKSDWPARASPIEIGRKSRQQEQADAWSRA